MKRLRMGFLVAPIVVALLASVELRASDALRMLVFSKTLLYRHASITNGLAMFEELGRKNGIAVDATEEAAAFIPSNLARYKVVTFLSTSGDVLNAEQRNAFKEFVEQGGGLVAIHAAVAGKVATEGDWPWYTDLLATEFDNHKAIEKATVRIEDRTDVSTAHLPAVWSRTDEWYNFTSSPRGKVHVLATLDEQSFHGGTMGDDHPVAWRRAMGKGRLWYTALGHTEASYTEPEFVQHVLGGVQYAGGIEPAKLAITASDERGELEIKFKGKRLLLYAYGTNQFKPYIKELYTLAGDNLLRDAPADHLHHHGLMYAIRVNGINFWEEVGEPGHESAGKIESWAVTSDAEGHPEARFTQRIDWHAHLNSTPLLRETRTITVSVNTATEEVAGDWSGAFEVGEKPVTLTGSFYNGLGLRLPESFDHVARHFNPENRPYSVEANRDLTPGAWSAVTGRLNGRTSTVALWQTPANAGETLFFTMLNPFAYLSVTQNLEKKPLEYPPGERFTVRYLVTLYSGEKSPEFLNERHRAWAPATPRNP